LRFTSWIENRKCEEDDSRYVSAGDVDADADVKRWHEDFEGWSCLAWTPAGKADIGGWVRDIRDNDGARRLLPTSSRQASLGSSDPSTTHVIAPTSIPMTMFSGAARALIES
jgi:hypothetical protein